MKFNIREVKTKSDKMRFIKSQWNFYKNDPNFVPPIIADRVKLLNTEKNPFYAHSQIQLFIAESDNEVVGRIAAIINDNHNTTHNDKVGFFGFFECIDNQEVANALFETAEKWLESKGMDTSRGPINPSMNDEVALLIDGFDSPPMILMNYNPRYYINLFEKAGYTKAKDLYAYRVEMASYRTEKMMRLTNAIAERYQAKIRPINFKDKAQFKKDVADLKSVYNAAWEPNWGFVKMTNDEFDALAADLKPVAEPKLTMILEAKGKLAGFALGLPNVNESLIHNKSGSLLGALWHLTTKKKQVKGIRIIVLGVLPEFQKTGIDSLLYMEFFNQGSKLLYEWGEASWILEDNEMMNKGLSKTMNGSRYKTYRIYDKKL